MKYFFSDLKPVASLYQVEQAVRIGRKLIHSIERVNDEIKELFRYTPEAKHDELMKKLGEIRATFLKGKADLLQNIRYKKIDFESELNKVLYSNLLSGDSSGSTDLNTAVNFLANAKDVESIYQFIKQLIDVRKSDMISFLFKQIEASKEYSLDFKLKVKAIIYDYFESVGLRGAEENLFSLDFAVELINEYESFLTVDGLNFRTLSLRQKELIKDSDESLYQKVRGAV